ncbi:MAG: hypothetical protein Q9225_005903 [Loekoesia sp. 1 TL-2023]
MPTKRYPGHAEREQFLEEALDPTRAEAQMASMREAMDIMQSEGLSLETRDLEELLEDESKRQDWFKKQEELSRQEFEVNLDEIALTKEDVDEFLGVKNHMELSLQQWKQKEEEGVEQIDQAADAIKEMIRTTPRLVTVIYQDPKVRQVVKEALDRLENRFGAMERRIDQTEKRLQQQVKDTLDDWQLPQRFKQHLRRTQSLVDDAAALRMEEQKATENLRSELQSAQDQVVKLKGHRSRLEAREASLEQDLQLSQDELSELRCKRDRLETSVGQLEAGKSRLERELQAAISDRDQHHLDTTERQRKLEEVEKERNELQKQMAAQAQTILDLQKQTKESGNLEDRLKDAKAELAGLQQTKTTEQREFRDEIARLEEDVRHAKEIGRTNLQEQTANNAAALDMMKEDYTKRLADSRTLRESFSDQMQFLKQKIRELENKYETLHLSANRLTTEKDRAQQRVEILQQEEQHAQADVSQLRGQCRELEESLNGLAEEKSELRGQLEKLRSEKESMEEEASVQHESIRQLLKRYAKTSSGSSLDHELLDKMVKCQI